MEPLDRLYQRLLEAVQREFAEGADRPLTIADIYQHLVPYRALRTEPGFAELAQYERVLLRLLAGERSYLQLAPPEVQEEFRRELETPSPIVGLYRDYAAIGVTLNPAATPLPPRPAPPPPLAPPPDPLPATAESTDLPFLDPGIPGSRSRAPACRSCEATLPPDRDARFCPYCGASQHPRPCAACSTPLEEGWRFCIRCGTARQVRAAE